MSVIRVEGPDERGLARVILNRPDARNAINLELCHALRDAFETLSADQNLKLVLLSAEGSVFSAGADLKERKGKTEAWVAARRRASFAAYASIEACPMPVVAVLDGPVIGGAGEIAMACDFALASPRARFRWPEVGWGTVGATQRLQRKIGAARAKELLFTGREMTAEEALWLGLVVRISDDLDSIVSETADAILSAPPLALRLNKQSVDLGGKTDLSSGIGIEMLAIDRCLADKEWQKGVSSFSEKTDKKN